MKPLSTRENQVVSLLMQGYANKNIRRELDIKPSTLTTYLRRFRQKMEARTLVQAMHLYTMQLAGPEREYKSWTSIQ